MCFWKGYLVLGMGQQLAFISKYVDGRDYDTLIEWYFECPSDICSMAVVSGKDGDEDKFLVIGFVDKKIRWYILRSNDDDSHTLAKAHSVKAHASRVAKLLVVGRNLYSGGGGSDPSIKLWKSVEDCEIGDNEKREKGLLMEHEGHTDIITCLHFMGDYLITGSGKQDGSLRVWEKAQKKSIQARITPHAAISAIYVVNDNVILTGGNAGDRKLCVWTTQELDSCFVSTNKCVIQ